MYEKSFLFIWFSAILIFSYLGYSLPPGGLFLNTLIGTVVGIVVGAALGFLIPIAAGVLLIGGIIYALLRLLL